MTPAEDPAEVLDPVVDAPGVPAQSGVPGVPAAAGVPAAPAAAGVPAAPAAAGVPEALTARGGHWRRVAIDTRPLRHPAYRRLFIGNAVSGFGIQFTAVAVPWQMYLLTHSSAWVGLLGAVGLVPLLVFALWGGAVADVVDRRRLLLASSLLSWVTTLALLVQAVLGLRSPLLILGLVAAQSAAYAVSAPARTAIVPRLIPTAEIAAANTLIFTAGNAAMVAGPLLAGLLVGRYPVSTAYGVDAAMFTVALWAALRLPALRPERTAASRSRTRDVLEGLRFIGSRPVLLLSFLVDIVAMFLALPRALFPQVAAQRFGGAGAVGWLYAAIAIGSVLAGLSSGWIGRVRRQGLTLVGAVVAWGLAVAAAGLASSLALCVALLAVAGAADLVSAVYRQTILQTYAPDELRGRMQGVFTAVVAGGPRLGDLRAGLTAQVVGPAVAWTGGGLASAGVAVLLAAAFPALIRYRATGHPHIGRNG